MHGDDTTERDAADERSDAHRTSSDRTGARIDASGEPDDDASHPTAQEDEARAARRG